MEQNQSKINYFINELQFLKVVSKHKRLNLFVPYYKLFNLSLFRLNLRTFIEIIIESIIYIKLVVKFFNYGPRFVALDFACIINIIFIKTFFYLLMKGKVKGYYRDNYAYFNLIIKRFCIFYYGAFIRLFIYLLTQDNLLQVFKAFKVYEIFLGVTLVSFSVIIALFYSQRIINIRDFNNAVMYLNKTTNNSILQNQDIVTLKIKENYLDKKNEKKSILLGNIKKKKDIILGSVFKKISKDKTFKNIYDGDEEGSKLFTNHIPKTKEENVNPYDLEKTDPNYRSKNPNDLEYYNPSIRHVVKDFKENRRRGCRQKPIKKINPVKKQDNVIEFPTKNRPS